MRDDSAITIVSGLPRSGTSLMMQMLQAGGLPPLSDHLRAPDEDNPRGYLGFEPVKRLRTDRSWLAQTRGHVVKIIHLLLRELPTEGTYRYRVILNETANRRSSRPLPRRFRLSRSARWRKVHGRESGSRAPQSLAKDKKAVYPQINADYTDFSFS